MKKQIIIILSSFLLLTAQQPKPTYVYICTGSKSVCYHKTDKCKGLKNCSGKIKKITEKEAVDTYKRRKCKVCY